MTPERKAELDADVDAFLAQFLPPKPKPKPTVVASEGHVVRDATVIVSPRDPNARDDKPTAVTVKAEPPFRLAGTVRINEAAVEAQYWERQADRARDRVQRRSIDPFGYGHWGRFDVE